jgi:hypothetical protein
VSTVTLTVVSNEIEAEALCGLLRVNGVACFYRRTDLSAGMTDGGGGAMAGPTEVLVDQADVTTARRLLPQA